MLASLLLLLGVAWATTPYQAALDRYVDAQGRVDYAGIRASGALDATVSALASAVEPTAADARMAFWINAYNALTIDLVADAWPIASIRDLDGGKVWDTRRFTVAGKQVTLNDIENKTLRPMGDPRVHAALNCASKGCPALAKSAYAAATLGAQLDAAARAWAAGNAMVLDQAGGSVAFNSIFDWYGADFEAKSTADVPGVEGKAEAAALWLANYCSAERAAWLRKGGYQVAWAPYDWSVNSRP
jgi:hypothetical protein